MSQAIPRRNVAARVVEVVMGDEEAALLRAIAAEPDEDTPRLVYADWLQEHGEEARAGFIRRQIENSRREGGTGVRAYRSLPSDARHTFSDLVVSKPWEVVLRDHLAKMVVLTGGRRRPNYRLCVAWHRGFPAVVGCTEYDWHRHHRAFAHGPPVLVCFSKYGGAWGTYSDQAGRWFVSRFASGLKVCVDPRDTNPLGAANEAAFPNARLRGLPCSRGELDAVCANPDRLFEGAA